MGGEHMGPVSATERLRQAITVTERISVDGEPDFIRYDVWYAPDDEGCVCADCGAEVSDCECTLPAGCVECGEFVEHPAAGDGLCTRCAVAAGVA